jgi:hypothetical protein
MPEFPSQVENRRFWVLETVREHQEVAAAVIQAATEQNWLLCRQLLEGLHGNDRRALLQSEGILTNDQIGKIGYW